MCMWCVCTGYLSSGLELQLITNIPVFSCEFSLSAALQGRLLDRRQSLQLH